MGRSVKVGDDAKSPGRHSADAHPRSDDEESEFDEGDWEEGEEEEEEEDYQDEEYDEDESEAEEDDSEWDEENVDVDVDVEAEGANNERSSSVSPGQQGTGAEETAEGHGKGGCKDDDDGGGGGSRNEALKDEVKAKWPVAANPATSVFDTSSAPSVAAVAAFSATATATAGKSSIFAAAPPRADLSASAASRGSVFGALATSAEAFPSPPAPTVPSVFSASPFTAAAPALPPQPFVAMAKSSFPIRTVVQEQQPLTTSPAPQPSIVSAAATEQQQGMATAPLHFVDFERSFGQKLTSSDWHRTHSTAEEAQDVKRALSRYELVLPTDRFDKQIEAALYDPVPPLWPTPSSDSSTPALDDAKLQFATEEVRKRFSAISMTDMLAVLSMLLDHPRSRQCAGTKTDGITKDPIHKAPPESGQTQTSARSCVGRNSTSCHQHPSSVNSSITASETSLGGWNTMDSEMDGVPLLNTPTASRLSQEWTTTLTSILDNARQYRQSADEHLTVVDVVRLSIKEWFDDVSVDAEESEKPFAASDSAVPEPPGWIATLAQVRRLAEEACHTKYKALYERLCSEAEDEGDEGMATPAYVLREDDSPMAPSVVARRSSHRVATESFGIPPFSLVIQCGGGGSGTEGPVSSVNIDLDARNDGTHCNGLESNSASFVVGCEWFQWVFLARSSLACQSEPYPVVEDGLTGADAEAAAAGQQKWRQRHCIVQLLYPSEAGFSDGSDGSSDLRSAEAQYELSDPHVVLSSLLGVAMRVWCRNHPHNVAQVFRLEEDTCPQHLYDGSLFWSAWPFRDAATLQQCESAATSRSMPIPLLPGECFSHDVDLRADGG